MAKETERYKKASEAEARGTMYEVRRRIGNSRQFEYLGTAGKKIFTDATLPAGVPSVTYRITAVRSTKRGESAEFVISFGVEGRSVAARMAA